MTLRSRKKPPTTAQIPTATETRILSSSLELRLEPGSLPFDNSYSSCRGNFSTAAVIAFVFVLLSIALVLPTNADPGRSQSAAWKPVRPQIQAPKPSNPKSSAQPSGWTEPERLEDTSTHLNWHLSPKTHMRPAASQTAPTKRALRSARQARDMPKLLRAAPKKLALQAIAVEAANKAERSQPKWLAESGDGSTTANANATTVQKSLSAARVSELPKRVPRKAAIATPGAPRREHEETIQQVQNLVDLRLPIANLRDSDLASKPAANSTGFAAPAPDEIGRNHRARVQSVVQRFKDQTPTIEVQLAQEFDPFAETSDATTRSVQANPKSNAGQGSGQIEISDLESPTSQPLDPSVFDPPSAAPPTLEPNPSFEQNPVNSPFVPANEPTFGDPTLQQDSAAAKAGSADIKEQIKRQLEKLEDLPTLGNGTEPLSEPKSGVESGADSRDGNDSPLFSDKDPTKGENDVVGDLSSTNGRDCEANAESCRTDMGLLDRRSRTDMSLDITPSIAPTEVDMAKVEEIRVEKMAKARPRTWADRSGNVIADGNLEDFRNDKVYIRSINGTIHAVPQYRLSDADRCFVNAFWELPSECNFEDEQYAVRDFRLMTFTWTAAGTCHKPLYFEQVGVERYGHSSGPIVQPLVSGVHFFGDILMLPYHVGLNPPNECQYTLGHYRPGDCAPWLMPGFPFTARGFKWEGLAIGAAITLLP